MRELRDWRNKIDVVMITARRRLKLCISSNPFSIRCFISGDYSTRNYNSSEICRNTSKNAQV